MPATPPSSPSSPSSSSATSSSTPSSPSSLKLGDANWAVKLAYGSLKRELKTEKKKNKGLRKKYSAIKSKSQNQRSLLSTLQAENAHLKANPPTGIQSATTSVLTTRSFTPAEKEALRFSNQHDPIKEATKRDLAEMQEKEPNKRHRRKRNTEYVVVAERGIPWFPLGVGVPNTVMRYESMIKTGKGLFKANPKISNHEFNRIMIAQFPELGLCSDYWKPDLIYHTCYQAVRPSKDSPSTSSGPSSNVDASMAGPSDGPQADGDDQDPLTIPSSSTAIPATPDQPSGSTFPSPAAAFTFSANPSTAASPATPTPSASTSRTVKSLGGSNTSNLPPSLIRSLKFQQQKSAASTKEIENRPPSSQTTLSGNSGHSNSSASSAATASTSVNPSSASQAEGKDYLGELETLKTKHSGIISTIEGGQTIIQSVEAILSAMAVAVKLHKSNHKHSKAYDFVVAAGNPPVQLNAFINAMTPYTKPTIYTSLTKESYNSTLFMHLFSNFQWLKDWKEIQKPSALLELLETILQLVANATTLKLSYSRKDGRVQKFFKTTPEEQKSFKAVQLEILEIPEKIFEIVSEGWKGFYFPLHAEFVSSCMETDAQLWHFLDHHSLTRELTLQRIHHLTKTEPAGRSQHLVFDKLREHVQRVIDEDQLQIQLLDLEATATASTTGSQITESRQTFELELQSLRGPRTERSPTRDAQVYDPRPDYDHEETQLPSQ